MQGWHWPTWKKRVADTQMRPLVIMMMMHWWWCNLSGEKKPMAQSLHQSEGMILISLRMGRLMKTNLAKSSLFWTTVMYKYMFLQQTTTTTTVCWSVITKTSRLFFAQGITVQAVINNVTKTFTLNNLSSVSKSSSDNDYQMMMITVMMISPIMMMMVSPWRSISKILVW